MSIRNEVAHGFVTEISPVYAALILRAALLITVVAPQLPSAARAASREKTAIEMEQLKCAQPQGDQNFGINLGVGLAEEAAQNLVELNLPAQHTQNQCSGEMAVGSGQLCNGFAAQ